MLANSTKVVWITGASSGLGRGMALQLANSGMQVIATARNRLRLDDLAAQNENIHPLAGDITDRDDMTALRERIVGISPHVDLAILNAGNCEYLDFPNPDWSAVRRVMEVNFFGTVNCLEMILPLLRASTEKRPQLAVVASQVTAAPFPRAEAYGASKAAVQYFCDSLRIDLAPENIDVSIINPGFVDTPLTRRNDFDMPFLMDVEEASRRILARLDTRPRQYTFPKRLSLLLALSKLAPALWQRSVAANHKASTRQTGT